MDIERLMVGLLESFLDDRSLRVGWSVWAQAFPHNVSVASISKMRDQYSSTVPPPPIRGFLIILSSPRKRVGSVYRY